MVVSKINIRRQLVTGYVDVFVINIKLSQLGYEKKKICITNTNKLGL